MLDKCLVCGDGAPREFLRIDTKTYWRCVSCEATMLDPEDRLSPKDEYAHYLHHENDPDDAGYRKFLSKLADPLLEKLQRPSKGLDYGCGPGPALAIMLREAGHDVSLYDPFFALEKAPLSETYDFIVCTEVAEHFHNPRQEFDRLGAMLKPGGWLAIMTCFQTDDERFARWHYRLDPTHVVFYREATLRFIADQHGWSCEIPKKDVVLMRKPQSTDTQ